MSATPVERSDLAGSGRAPFQLRRFLVDLGVALLYLSVFGQPPRVDSPWLLTVGLVSSAVIIAGLVLRWRWPVPVFATVFCLTLLRAGAGWSGDPFFAAAWVLYPVALTRHGPSARSARILEGFLVALLILALSTGGLAQGAQSAAGFVLISALMLGGSWELGRAVSEQRRQAALSAEALAQSAVAEERLRIAREMHDVVSHTLVSIGVQAGVTRRVVTDDVDALRAVLGELEIASRGALEDMRVMLGSLRAPQDRPLRPQPRIEDLGALTQAAVAAGVTCQMSVDRVNDLGDGLQLTTYRIVQESLTNVIRHAPGSRCTVRVEGTSRGVDIEVLDDGPGDLAPHGSGGHGLVGMRERALAHRGTLTAGNRPQGGFRVHAVLPERTWEATDA